MGECKAHSKRLSDFTKEIWDYVLVNEVMITTNYSLLGTNLNLENEFGSRSVVKIHIGFSSKWKLEPINSKTICKAFWTPDMDLFASRVSH